MDEATDTLPAPTEMTERELLADLRARVDMLGKQLDWLCENMNGLFQFIAAVGQQGGGIRGLMSAMKQAPKDMQVTDISEVTNG